MARESELKRRPRDRPRGQEVVAAIVASCERMVGPSTIETLTSRYLDDDQVTLGRHGVGLRVRGDRGARETCWTVKIGAVPDARGLAIAREYETLGSWSEVPAALSLALRSLGIGLPLVEIATFDTTRERWLGERGGAELEICLDVVHVAFPRRLTFVEIEVESQARDLLRRLVDEIDERFPDVTPSPASKLATALAGSACAQVGAKSTSLALSVDRVEDLGGRLADLLEQSTPIITPWSDAKGGVDQ